MDSWPQDVIRAVARVADATSVDVSLPAGGVAIGGRLVVLPKLNGERADLFGLQGLLPTVPHGDDRDKLLWQVLVDARAGQTPDQWKPPPLDSELLGALPERLPFGDPDASQTIADALTDRFYSSKRTKGLLPLHGSLPMNYTHSLKTGGPARWRTFSGEIMTFLLFDATKAGVDTDLLETLLALFNSKDDLTALDRLFLDVAGEGARDPEARPDAGRLLERYEAGMRELAASGGAFCAPSLRLFRQDLATVLATPLPRPDKVQWLTLLLSLHIGVRLYRLAVVKGNELDLAVAAAADVSPPASAGACDCKSPTDGGGEAAACLERCPLAGLIRFRTGSGRYRPVSRRDGCRESYVDLDQHRLLALPASLVTTNLALLVWASLGGPARPAGSMDGLAAHLRRDERLRAEMGAACSAIAVLHHATYRPEASLRELVDASGADDGRHGLVALRDGVLRLRRNDLRHQSRDVLNQLLLDANSAGGGSLISRNGTHTFFEVDERMLLLLVRLACGDGSLPYEAFLGRLRAYGLAPQDADERAALADSLERLGLLVRYSDAGEASFVHYS